MLLQYIYTGPSHEQYWIYWEEPPYQGNTDDTYNDKLV